MNFVFMFILSVLPGPLAVKSLCESELQSSAMPWYDGFKKSLSPCFLLGCPSTTFSGLPGAESTASTCKERPEPLTSSDTLLKKNLSLQGTLQVAACGMPRACFSSASLSAEREVKRLGVSCSCVPNCPCNPNQLFCQGCA